MSKQEEKNEAENNDEKPDEQAQAAADNAENGAPKDGETAAELTPEEKITGLEAQIADLHDQLLRKAADFENFRKRNNQDKQNAIEYANQSLLLDIIPVIDDMERAIQAGEASSDTKAFLEGVKMIEKRLTSQLETKWGLKRFTSEGEPFDPNRHEALMVEKAPDITEAVVKEDLSRGYLLKDRVIRTSKVKVLMPEDK
jgi:molecular chaperone GrpE